ncbi:MAG: 3-deoxy-7-phosphoheptulonate synthase [Candidatus Cloacimonetes bacterium]|nr:3-deoxy-7-phosphoheptulonate synthase [Candidatus Cloacimonadota bacterium]
MERLPIKINNIKIFDDNDFSIIAGPCAIEDEESLVATAELLVKHNVKMLRGGAYKLRTSPQSFQGYGDEAVKLLSNVAKSYNLLSVSEIPSVKEIDIFNQFVDIILIGTRNMYNYPLLKEVGEMKKPVILKRGMCATVNEWILAAEYIAQNGNQNIILCERGIRTFETVTRNTLDLASAVYVAHNFRYHVIVDPSHATGKRELVIPMTLASKAAGVHGVMIEIHPKPDNARSDPEQMLDFDNFEKLMEMM